MYITVNGLELFYEQTGTGRPLVLVHGNDEDHTIFDEAVEVLKDKYTCYAIDSRDHGRSEKCRELHYEDMASDVIALIEQLDLQDVVYYGFSDGGIIGLYAAAKCPRITDMIISGTNLSPAGVKPLLRMAFKGMSLFRRDGKITLMLKEPNIDISMLHGIRARTLVLAGEKDAVTEKETLQIGANIPGAEIRILPKEGHGSYIVHNVRIAGLIDEFVSRSRKKDEDSQRNDG